MMRFSSPSGRLRLEYVDRFLHERDAAQPLLVVAPSWGVAGEVMRRKPRCSFGWYRLSWDQLIWRLAEPECLRRGLEPLSALASWGCLQRALQMAPPVAYRTIHDYPGFCLVLEKTLRECRLAGVSPGDELEATAAAYQRILDEEGLVDEAGLRQLALEAVDSDRWVGSLQAVVGLELTWDALWERLAARIPKVVRVEAGPGPDSGPLQKVRSNLFVEVTLRAPPQSLQVLSAGHCGAECMEVAREVLQRARQGVAWDEMAILLRQPETYLQPLQAALQRAQIPGFFTRGLRRPCPEGRAFAALLECGRQNLSARAFNEYLALGQLPVEAFRGEPEEDADRPARELPLPYRWQELIGSAEVIQGRERWRKRLSALDSQRQLQIAVLEREEPDSPRLEQYRRDMQQLQGLRDFALPILDRLESYRSPRKWSDWLAELGDLARVTLATPDPVLHLLEQLEPLAELGPVDFHQVLETLKPELLQLRSRSLGHRHGKLFIGTLEESRGRSFRFVFLPGMCERRFPPTLKEDPLLSSERRERLGLPTLSQRAEEEKALLRSALGAADEQVIASFPRREESRPLLPSLFLLELMRAATGQLPSPQEILDATLRAEIPEPALALDEPEEGLTWLRKVRSKASHRFLLDRHEGLRKAMRGLAEHSAQSWKASDGCIELPDVGHFAPRHRPYSASALHRFAACPYQFWMAAAYRLAPREEPEPLEELDALTRGNLIHDLHARLVWRAAGQSVSTSQLQKWMEEEWSSLAMELSERQLVLMPRLHRDEMDQLRRDFWHWLEKRNDSVWVPIYAELAFGLTRDSNRDPASRAEPAALSELYRLRGSIDRIERGPAGTLRVVDLKSGKADLGAHFDIDKGKAMQPALYALAVQNELGVTVEKATLEYCTVKGAYRQRGPANLKQAMDTALAALEKLDESAARGNFPAHPAAKACEWCDMLSVCGTRAGERARAKQPSLVLDAIEWWRNQK